MKKLERIMLIDDDKNTNFFHKIILEQVNAAEEIVIFQMAQDALDYLQNGDNRVTLLFLDINMPIMNGWQFLEHYNQLAEENKAETVIIMLTSSINPRDEEKAKENSLVKKFVNKPLTVEKLTELIESLE